ncbi:hypothetical protein LTR78_003664 [Recurvomyces mirabilis]|uniref:SMP-30/Gluconolactonase/LRE-like region domain-containing protein n=1 Tax=Recurvomyces mirabilis TaxID=574656 RepID=A0AAE0WRB2_9PEZI|nr:hypothetical protein LTR78_003664 [Recurvomyces mirabilis]
MTFTNLSCFILLALSGWQTTSASSNTSLPLPVHNITRVDGIKFENLAVRSNGQILTTTSYPNASIYQVDPLGVLPTTLIYAAPNIISANGIVELEHDIFYVAVGSTKLLPTLQLNASSYAIIEVDVRNVSVFPNGSLTCPPTVKQIASLPHAAQQNGIALPRPLSDNLLLADSLRSLTWKVDICNGTIGVALNDTTTKGSAPTGAAATGVNGLKVHDGMMYYTSTGANKLYKVPVDELGIVSQVPTLVTTNLACDDLVIDHEGTAYVAGPLDVLLKVSPSSEQTIIVGTINPNQSALVGPTAARFGRLASDRWSLYITTNGGLQETIPGTTGVSRIDLESR